MEVLLDGAAKAGDFGGQAVANAVRGLDFDSLLGHISYDPSGDLKDPTIYIFRVQDGEFVQVFPVD
jgi:ABC-type branched-subunit amino acid transport system substrate-binding protein